MRGFRSLDWHKAGIDLIHLLALVLAISTFVPAKALMAQHIAGTITAPAGAEWIDMVLYSGGGKLFVADRPGVRILVYNASTLEFSSEIPLSAYLPSQYYKPQMLALHEGTGTLYVAADTGAATSDTRIVVINAVSNELVTTIDGLGMGLAIYMDEGHGRLYTIGLSDWLDETLTAVNVNTNGVIGTLNLDALAGDGLLSFSRRGINPVTGELFFSNIHYDKFLVVDGLALTGEAISVPGSRGYAGTWNPVENKIYITKIAWNGYFIYDRDTGGSTTTTCINDATPLFFSEGTNRVYSDAEIDGKTTVIEGVTDSCQDVNLAGGYGSVGFVNTSHHAYFSGIGAVKILDEGTLSVIKSFSTCGAEGYGAVDDSILVDQDHRRIFTRATWSSPSQNSCIVAIDDDNPVAMTSPAPGSTLTSSSVTYTWSAGTGATEYYLQVGTTPGGQELYSVSEGTNLSATVVAIPTDGSPVYARLWWKVGALWSFTDYTYTACSGCTATKAAMTTPGPGSTLTASMTTFWWNTSLGSECYLQVGTTLGGQEIYSAGQGTGLSAVVWGLPTDGSPVYARLWSNIGGAWLYNDYTYTACTGCMGTKAVLTTPAPGATLSSSMATLWWSASVASECYLQVGTTLGGQQLYSAGQGTGLSAVVPGLPTDGSTVYVRLWSNVNGAWLYNDYTYATCSGCMGTEALMTGPAPGTTLGSTVVTFTWSASLASECYLQVGTTLGGQELYSAGEGTSLSSQVVDLPNNGSAVYVRLWSNVGGAWSYKDYTYTACTGCVATKGAMTSPVPGSSLNSTAVTFTWSAGLASEYYLFVGRTAGGQEIYGAGQATNLTAGVTGLPNDGSTVYVRLWSRIGGAWLFSDYTYTACSACQ